MSYILDALRKSEAERARGEAPSLLTTTDPHRVVPRYAIWLLIAILSVNALLLMLWLVPFPESSEMTTPSPAMAPSYAPTTPVTAEERDVPAPAPAVAAARPETDAAVEAIAPPTDPGSPGTVPQIEFSTHVYSEDPGLRAVTVGGRRFNEGEDILPGVRLVEITETGVVIESGGLRSEIDVLQEWR